MVRSLVAESSTQRALAADQVTDWVGSYTEVDGRLLAAILAVTAACETDGTALESQLNAIIQLGALADRSSVSYLKEIEGSPLPGDLSGYVHDILHE
ncbi:hypothetical protein [Streptomyces sp. NBC_00091]|uniref:hypothetical protein n=1 Tax=Streptomyces sp. NBC_00091 TaxID=2975648 RepID=UPI0022552BC6|nr:hypothetical protein [Streptomyces sp. NBC_00091]MCX5376758.1 hypothetical protein [Streptomyces sp. NBC_00091]